MSVPGPFCDRLADALEDIVAGRLAADERRAVDAHLETCAECRLLVDLAGDASDAGNAASSRLPAPAVTPDPAPDLAREVLRRTAGDPCARARVQLCARVDGDLTGIDADLVDLHVSRCGGCAGLAAALADLAEVLPDMAEEMPDEHFVDDVLARTLPLAARLRRLAARAVSGWQALLRRPRFTWEAAYVGAAMLSLVFGAPASPLRDVPKQALAMVQIRHLSGADDQPSLIQRQLSAGGDLVWRWTGEPALSFLGAIKTDVSALVERTADERTRLARHSGELGRAVLRIESRDSLNAIGRMGDDMKALWSELARGDDRGHDDDNGNESDEPVAGAE